MTEVPATIDFRKNERISGPVRARTRTGSYLPAANANAVSTTLRQIISDAETLRARCERLLAAVETVSPPPATASDVPDLWRAVRRIANGIYPEGKPVGMHVGVWHGKIEDECRQAGIDVSLRTVRRAMAS